MNLLTRLRSWLKWVVKRQRLETDLEAEVRFHLDSYAGDLAQLSQLRTFFSFL